MPSRLTCPEEAELLPLAMGDPVPAEVDRAPGRLWKLPGEADS